jgi:hypothetical protein
MDEKVIFLTGDQCSVDLEIKEENRAQLPQIIDEIVESCKTVPTIAHYDTAMIPSKESVIDILEDLKDLLFPGYFRHQGFDSYSLGYHLVNLVTTSSRSFLRRLPARFATNAAASTASAPNVWNAARRIPWLS